MNQPDNEALHSSFLSAKQWAEHEVLNHLHQSVKGQLASLTRSEQLRYRQLVRQYARALEGVEREDRRIKDDFEAFGVQAIRGRILAATGKDLDPRTTYIHTRYLYTPNRQDHLQFPKRLRRSADTVDETQALSEPQAIIDEYAPKAHVLSMSLWQAACINFGFMSYFASFNSDSLVNASFINHSAGGAFSYPQDPDLINTTSLIPATTFISIARSLNLGAGLKDRIDSAMSASGTLHTLLRTCTKAHLQFCLMELYRSLGRDHADRDRVKTLSEALDSTPSRLRVRQIVMTIKFTPAELVSGWGFYPTGGATIPTKPAPEAETEGHHVSIPLFQIEILGAKGVFSFFPGRPGGELRLHANSSVLIADFRAQLLRARTDRQMDWFRVHLTQALYTRLTVVAPTPKDLDGSAFIVSLPHGRRDWIAFEGLGFKPLSLQTSLEQAVLNFQSNLYESRLRQLAVEKSVQDWADIASAISTLFEELTNLLLIPVPGAINGLNRCIKFLFVGVTVQGLYSALEQSSQGDSSGLLHTLADTMDILISSVLIGAAARLARGRHAKLLQSMGQPRTYLRSDGSTGLWSSDAARFALAPASVTDKMALDEQGIYRHSGRDYAFLEQDGRQFAVEIERNQDGTWRVIAKADPNAFKPPVIWDATQRRWQLDLDDSPSLTEGQLLRRMVRGLTPEAAQIALTVSAVSRADLQRIWQGGAAPASLTDAVTRFQADTQLQRCADELSRYPQLLSLTERPLLALMTQLPFWPPDKHLFVTDHKGVFTEMYGQFTNNLPTLQTLLIKRLDDGELTLNHSSFFKAFESDFLSDLIRKLSLPTDTVQMAQLMAAQLTAHKHALFTALTLHKDHLPPGGPASSLDLTWLPLEQPKKTPLLPIIIQLRSMHPGLSLARCHELLALQPLLGSSRGQLNETLQRRNQLRFYALPEPIYRAVTNGVFSARLERMLDGFYHPRAFNPDVDQWSKDICTLIIKKRLNIELVIVANPLSGDVSADYRYSDHTLVITDLGSGVYAAYDRRQHALMPAVSGPDSFFAALIAGLTDPTRATRLRSSDLMTAAAWRKVVIDDLNRFRTPEGFINTDIPQVESYALPDVAWSAAKRPDAKGIYIVDDAPGIVLEGKFYEVQSATDGLTNSIIDSRRFARSPIPVFGNDVGTWRHEFERPMEWDGQYLFRRLGYIASGFDSHQITAILNISNTTDEMLRRVHMNRERIPPLLSDTLQRFPDAQRLESSTDRTDPMVEMLKRVFPSLSTSLATDLVRSANELEIQQMQTGRVPLRLSQEARWYVREVRVNGALEGFYLPARQNNDSVKLMLHGLARQPGWSAGVKVEVREGTTSGPLISSLGPDSASVALVVVKTAEGWHVFSAPERDVKASGQDLLKAVLVALPDRERQALGYAYAGGDDELKDQLTLRAIENRDGAYEVLGMAALRPWFKPPKRLADGRIGYSLSGRGSATDRFLADHESRKRYERIYPLSENSGRELQRMRRLGLDINQELGRLEGEARTLQKELRTWLNQRPDFEVHDVAAQYHKDEMATVLIKAWRKETPALTDQAGNVLGYTLVLENWRVPTLPVLTADFSHIRQLKMVGMRVGAGMGLGVDANINQFLLNFRSLTSLDIHSCRFDDFPEAIGRMGNLLELSLADSGMRLDRAAQQRLAGLVHMQHLNLSGCGIEGRLDVSSLSELQSLDMSSTQAVIWPRGVMQLAHLIRLDLSANHIISVPEEVLLGSEVINRGTSLRENELAPSAIRQLRDYQARTGINFGLHHDANHPQRLGFDDGVWLNGIEAEERQARFQECQLLRDDPRATNFFKLIDDLKTTADFERSKHDLVPRVQRMLKAVAENERVRDSLFKLVSEPWACCDSAALLFSRMEIQVLVSRALADDDPERAELTLLRIIRGEFRLKVLDGFAVKDGAARGGPVDVLEIGFTYRLELTEALELPAQPKYMKFTSLGSVDPQAIVQAREAILAMDNGEAMLDYMADDPMWDAFLRERYTVQFDALYNEHYCVVPGREVCDAEGYERGLQALRNRLTLDALARLNQ